MYLKEILKTWKKPLKFESNFEITKNKILKILEAGRFAPSGENQQVWRFLVIDTQKGKDNIIQSVIAKDPRLETTLQDVKSPELRSNFIFSTENYNAKSDKYKNVIFKHHPNDIDCAKSASFFILCTHKNTITGKIFGSTDMGAAITNMILISYELGYYTRWVRIFDREFIKEKFNIPQSMFIDAVLAIGKAKELLDTKEYKRKDFKDFYFYNLWGNNLEGKSLQGESINYQNYDIDAVDAIVDRRSIRKYDENKDIPKGIILELLKAGMMIPLTIDRPYLKIIIIDDKDVLKQVAKSAKIVVQQSHVRKVPLIIVITYDCSNNSPGFYAETDTGSIIQNILLRAHTLGIGSCWIGAFNRRNLRKILNIPKDWHIPSMAIFGYPKNYPKPTPRIDLGKICFYNSWKNYIEKRHRTLLPDYHVLSVGFRKFKKTRVSTILRSRKVGIIEGIPEFESLC